MSKEAAERVEIGRLCRIGDPRRVEGIAVCAFKKMP